MGKKERKVINQIHLNVSMKLSWQCAPVTRRVSGVVGCIRKSVAIRLRDMR